MTWHGRSPESRTTNKSASWLVPLPRCCDSRWDRLRPRAILLAPSINRLAQLAEGEELKPDLLETAALAHAAFGATLRDLGQSTEAEEALLVSRQL